MRPIDGAGAGREGGCEHFVNVEKAQAGQSPHHVNDGVDSTHIVEMHGLYRLAVDLGFRLGEPLENPGGLLPILMRQAGLVDDAEYVAERTWSRCAGNLDDGLSGGKAGAGDSRCGEVIAVEAELRQLTSQIADGHAAIDNGAEEHVAAYAGEDAPWRSRVSPRLCSTTDG